jgi:hypothetical protein
MDRIELLKTIKYLITAVSERDRHKIIALDAHLESLRVSEEYQGNLYVIREVVTHALKEI